MTQQIIFCLSMPEMFFMSWNGQAGAYSLKGMVSPGGMLENLTQILETKNEKNRIFQRRIQRERTDT